MKSEESVTQAIGRGVGDEEQRRRNDRRCGSSEARPGKRIDGEQHQQDAVREQQAGCQAPRGKAQDAGGGGREHVRGIVIEHERLSGEQERRQALHVRISELRDLGGVNRIVRPDRNEAGRLDGRQRTRRMVTPGGDENGNHHDRQNVQTIVTRGFWSRAKRPGSGREHDSRPREKHVRGECSGGHAADEEDEARREAAKQDRQHMMRRIRVADRPDDDHRASNRNNGAAEDQRGNRGSIERCAAGRDHRAGEGRDHEPIQQGRQGQLPRVRAQSRYHPSACSTSRTMPATSDCAMPIHSGNRISRALRLSV